MINRYNRAMCLLTFVFVMRPMWQSQDSDLARAKACPGTWIPLTATIRQFFFDLEGKMKILRNLVAGYPWASSSKFSLQLCPRMIRSCSQNSRKSAALLKMRQHLVMFPTVLSNWVNVHESISFPNCSCGRVEKSFGSTVRGITPSICSWPTVFWWFCTARSI